MDFLKSLTTAASGLKAQSSRMRIIAENIANADSAPSAVGGQPYRRKIPTFTQQVDRETGASLIEAGRVRRDTSPFRTKYDPGNPSANARGEVAMPNVNGLIENMDMREAQRSYEANLNMVTATRRMVAKTLEILKA
ncbi:MULTISPECIES: flagellar basal body rod protein FlgC [unclassified Methylobacterium]|jgi:flagellar basal-body rod protein FlgC|uniref:flagellar basal body rod protein FlgC n=1 Tax=unclassified Methylobacterium TaxID=2615210 RepID=UPI00070103E6|nr:MULTISPECIES: flagellar basal body rod protein FlgC [unclassified Methylobacterium]KQO66136.1 flagellar basal-body rod protein FlgC [Methylobacterium sp. Leaf89]KQO73230.1 flagellar basal-body rod protein FlgC [Methylobacterium sp. Leaf88]KQP68788.1 flagellar basal-body rod protein FlgC [Methylobacterium sp. Leaf111]KQT81799.1 flagellar basal-body rod protein FlgC [Methylobacterium sp. Leaf465]KQU26338.1 flagellar basal-body rod protein FlgC [Methylobacterium sp. Leaf94]